MRKTGFVTQREFGIPGDTPLVPTTDLQSRITHGNPACVAVSAHAREQLSGQPHNLIRHPDMPAEAFCDLWTTLQAGRPWTALVNSRRQDRDHRWVRANVAPVRDASGICGCMSVRTAEASRQTAQASGDAHKRIDGVRAVAGHIAEIDAQTPHNEALVEQLSATSPSLAQQAQTAVQSVQVLRMQGTSTYA